MISEKNMEKPTVLIVDDDDGVRTQMKWALNPHYNVLLAEDRTSALELLNKAKPCVVTLDLGLPPLPADTSEGFLTLSEMLQVDPSLKVLVVTGQDDKENGMEAIGQGAYDFFAKPVNIDELKIVLDRAIYVQQLERERRQMIEAGRYDSFEGIIGASPQMESVFATIEKVSKTDASILIVGESGTGKELIARAIHRRSVRNVGPFIAINCGAIPETLLESELFGHEKGAFTGAHIQRQGRIEMAQGGTLFLDEIAELSGGLQVKLLRFLQEHQLERIGGRSLIHVDARVLAATNLDLTKAMADGRFREDLYYRLNIIPIVIPPLRNRRDDIPVLVDFFIAKHIAGSHRPIRGLTPGARNLIMSYSWPGNVRQLESAIERAILLCEGNEIEVEDLPVEIRQEGTSAAAFNFKLPPEGISFDEVERSLITQAMEQTNWNITRAAKLLGLSFRTLQYRLEKFGIKKASKE